MLKSTELFGSDYGDGGDGPGGTGNDGTKPMDYSIPTEATSVEFVF